MSFSDVQAVNATLEVIAAQTQITSLTDGSPAAVAANIVYAPVVQLVLRETDPDFARFTASLATAAGGSLPPPWLYEYLYPADCIRLRQVRPPAAGPGSLTDLNDPQPIRASVAFDSISSAATKVILTNQQNALAVYTSASVTPAQWDSAFFNAVTRRLANPLALALSGRPDLATEALQQAAAEMQAAEAVDEAMITGA